MSLYINEVPQRILHNDIRPTLTKNRTKYIHIRIKLIQTIEIFMSLRTLANVRVSFFLKPASTGNVGSVSSCSANYLISQHSGSADHHLLRRHAASYQLFAQYFMKSSHLDQWFTNCAQGIRGYISVMATWKFTLLLIDGITFC